MNWHMRLHAQVRWLNKLSDIFVISGGIRQGAVISPKFLMRILIT